MSLYADEDLALVQDAGPSTSSSLAPADPLTALASALTCTPETQAQAEAFLAAGQRFEENPEKLPDLCNQLLPMVVDGGESLLRAWTLDMVALTVGRSGLKLEIKEEGKLSPYLGRYVGHKLIYSRGEIARGFDEAAYG